VPYFAEEHTPRVAPSPLVEQCDGVPDCSEQRHAFQVLFLPRGMMVMNGGENLFTAELARAERGECHFRIAAVSLVVVVG